MKQYWKVGYLKKFSSIQFFSSIQQSNFQEMNWMFAPAPFSNSCKLQNHWNLIMPTAAKIKNTSSDAEFNTKFNFLTPTPKIWNLKSSYLHHNPSLFYIFRRLRWQILCSIEWFEVNILSQRAPKGAEPLLWETLIESRYIQVVQQLRGWHLTFDAVFY